MKIGTVVAPVWATKKCDSLTGHTLLVVKTQGQTLVVDDLVGAGAGDVVIVSTGSAARLANPNTPIDAAVIGIVDQTEEHHVYQ